ncbi:MAG: ABC transporter ATP-binding protein [Deltaproteobacteria bacterium]|nr:ABC transporter ATP-binding protein [Deltaproteobacteria bacterium]
MRRLFQYLGKHRAAFYVASVWSILNKVLDLMPPILVGWVIDSVRREPPEWITWVMDTSEPFPLAAFLAGLGVGVFALESLFQWLYQRGFMRLAQQVQHELRVDAYSHIQNREIAFFENHRMGETMAMLGDDVNQLERFLNTGFNDLLQLCVLFLFSGAVMLGVSWELALIGILPIPLIIWGSFRYQSLISPRYAKVREAVGHLNSRLENNIAGIQVIKSFTAEAFETNRVEKASLEYQNANFSAIHLSAVYVPLIRMAVSFGFGGVLLLGSYWVLEDNGRLSVGELVLFSMMIQRVLWPLTRLGVTLDDFERAGASARRTFGLLDSESKIVDPETITRLDNYSGSIEFDAAAFEYVPGQSILSGVSFKAAPGETIGIAGTTGSGKSTLVKLLLRYYDLKSGSVKLDGVDIRAMGLKELREQISLVSQDVYLFHGTIAENIAYGAKEMEMGQIRDAAKMARLDDFVNSLPEGYETIVGERGIRLSGGQRQRLSIARAILKNAPVMVFDEATSSVDTETERAIQENLHALTQGKTALVIAHRLSTIRHADRILVLKNGEVAEAGNHQTLIDARGVYAELWRIQVGDVTIQGESASPL